MARVGASEPLNAPFGTGARPEASCRRSRSIQRGKRRFAATQIDSIVRVRLLSCSAALEMRSRRESTSQGDDPLDRIGRSDNVSMRRSSIELVARRALEVASCTRRLGSPMENLSTMYARSRLGPVCFGFSHRLHACRLVGATRASALSGCSTDGEGPGTSAFSPAPVANAGSASLSARSVVTVAFPDAIAN
jgi:hypothetical protein